MVSVDSDFFTLFGLPRRFALDRAALEEAYHELQHRVHPDRFAHLSGAEKRVSMHWATRVNEGWRTLREPLARARYLLELAGVDLALDSNTAMPPAFLMAQMEWREQLADARRSQDVAALEGLAGELQHVARQAHDTLARQLDEEGALAAAAGTVRQLMFIDKLEQEIEDALSDL